MSCVNQNQCSIMTLYSVNQCLVWTKTNVLSWLCALWTNVLCEPMSRSVIHKKCGNHSRSLWYILLIAYTKSCSILPCFHADAAGVIYQYYYSYRSGVFQVFQISKSRYMGIYLFHSSDHFPSSLSRCVALFIGIRFLLFCTVQLSCH
jgi:hypothetical protein